MAYVQPNYHTKKALREALASGTSIDVYQPGLGTILHSGRIALEGPHYPAAHSWYGEGIMRDGKLVEVK